MRSTIAPNSSSAIEQRNGSTLFAGVLGDAAGGMVSDHIYRRTRNRRTARVRGIQAGFLGAFVFLVPVVLSRDLLNPSARRSANSDPNPPANPVRTVVSETTTQQSDNARRGPSRSPTQPPINWKAAYGMANAENTRPIRELSSFESDLTSVATAEMLTRSTKRIR